MTRTRQQISAFVPPTYEQYLASFQNGLARLISQVMALTSESDLNQSHRTSFGYLFNTAHAHLFWNKDQIVDAFAPLNTKYVRCLDCCPGVYRREGAWAEKFGDEEVVLYFDLMTRSAAAEWISDYGHKVGYTAGQIERARLEQKGLRRKAA